MHEKFTGANFYRTAAEARDVIHRSLQRPIVRTDNVGISHADGNSWLVLHFGMHGPRKLFLGTRGIALLFRRRERSRGESRNNSHLAKQVNYAFAHKSEGIAQKP